MRFFSAKPEKNSLINREYPFSAFVPYLYHLDKNIVYTKKNQLVQVIKLGGFSFETADDDDVDTFAHTNAGQIRLRLALLLEFVCSL